MDDHGPIHNLNETDFNLTFNLHTETEKTPRKNDLVSNITLWPILTYDSWIVIILSQPFNAIATEAEGMVPSAYPRLHPRHLHVC